MLLSLLLNYFLLLSVHSISNLTCISMPSLDHLTTTLSIICTCPKEKMAGHISLAGFANSLSQFIADKILVVDLRNCWSLDIIMDQTELRQLHSKYFRPNIQLEKINVENCHQVKDLKTLLFCIFFVRVFL